MPSRYESLSLVVLEAWRMARPVLCNGDCETLRGQCLRSNGGLYYRNRDEFQTAMDLIIHRTDLRNLLGSNGYRYYNQNYSWKVIISKYQRLLESVRKSQS